MSANTAALQERVAEELYYEQHPEGRHRGEWPAAVHPDTVHEYRDLAAAVLPIIAAEVQAAKAEAWREYAAALEAVPDYAPTEYDKGRVDQRHATVEELHVRATETGDQA